MPMQKTFLLLGVQVIAAGQTATFQTRAQPYLEAALNAGQPFVVVSAASAMPSVAPESLATLVGQNLASQTAGGVAPYPTSLGGISLQVVDSAGAVRVAPLLYVSPTQINFVVPTATAPGTSTLNILNGTSRPLTGSVQIQKVAPGLFTANENGQGVVSATAYHTVIPTSVAVPVLVYQCVDVPRTCRSVPLAIGVDVPVFVTVNATGLRSRSNDAAVKLTIGSQSVTIQRINALDDAGSTAGIDELFFPLPLSLRNSGEVDMIVTVDGATSNTTRINVM
jgi:uncharacterized protein (TIGR03437 family)